MDCHNIESTTVEDFRFLAHGCRPLLENIAAAVGVTRNCVTYSVC